MARTGATKNWIERGAMAARSTDEDARIGFLINAYMACDSEGRSAIIAATSGIADAVEKRRASNPAAVLHFSGTEA
ncbi:MAG TPA: hypothetical protein IAA22_06620 [Candidatus Olsenella stercoravium]|uniref:Uncharacterized protein n=1 Tax=Candidatus Olsenella stercoravium TaxID=2838713 RepID=A0A9D2IPL6_9ACTN|nr:hypothetical protein [Candidatus Olsenella stercoravium]